MKRHLLGLIIVALLISACGDDKATATATPEPTATETPSATATPEPTATETPTPEPTATETPTPESTATETPTLAPTPTKAPSVERIRDVPYVVDGDPKQELDVYLRESQDGPFPALLAIHGGGADKRDLTKLALYFADLGYVVVSINHRTMPQNKYPAQVQDVFCALAWMHANADAYNIDPGRIVALGHSSGGTFAATLGMVDDPARFLQGCPHSLPETDWVQGVVAFTGIFDYESAASHSSGLRSYIDSYLDGEHSAVPETWAEASPVTWVDGSDPPTLLIHGEADTNIPPVESSNFAAALQAAGVKVELLLIPGADHGVIIRSEQSFQAVQAFLDALNAE